MTERETTSEQRPHDILAAEEFAMPAPDPDLHHRGPVALPADPAGDQRPHDVLAAEEFPMPAQSPHPPTGLVRRRGGPRRFGFEVAVALLAVAVVWRWLR